tara:strand:- start:318 stop:566 length:249 start_codon:yes stop_codon:yes gene_type:complete
VPGTALDPAIGVALTEVDNDDVAPKLVNELLSSKAASAEVMDVMLALIIPIADILLSLSEIFASVFPIFGLSSASERAVASS